MTVPRPARATRWLALLTAAGAWAALSGCDAIVAPAPEIAYATVDYPRVLQVDDAVGALSYSLVQHRDRGEQSDRTWTWQVVDGDALRKRDDTVGFATPPLAAQDGLGNLWTARALNRGLAVCHQLSRPLSAPSEQCFRPALQYAPVVREMVADGQGDMLLLSRHLPDDEPAAWQALWMRAGDTANARVFDLSPMLPATASPRLVHGAMGARLVWQDGDRLKTAVLDEAPDWRWRMAEERPQGLTAPWLLRAEGGANQRLWRLHCPVAGMLAERLDANGWQPLPAPPLPACSSTIDLQMAASANGDAMLVWKQAAAADASAFWAASRWIDAESRWAAAETLAAPVPINLRLVADDTGHFVVVHDAAGAGTNTRRLLARVYRPADGWQPAIDLGTVGDRVIIDSSGVYLDFDAGAGGDGQALVAWAEPSSQVGSPERRLTTRRLDLRQQLLALQLAVTGDGRVHSLPAGLDCPGRCDASFGAGSSVQLSAEPAPGQRFSGWAGACSGSSAQLTLVLDQARRCSASFAPLPQSVLTLAVQGGGSIAADPPGPAYAVGAAVQLTATADPGQRFVAWGGDADCSDAQLTMDADRSCSASFAPDPALARLSVAVAGPGRVSSQPAGIACAGVCNAFLPVGSAVTLIAEPEPGVAVAWSGSCSGSALAVSLTLDAATSCSASFQRLAPVDAWRMLGNAPADAGVVGRPALAVDAQGVPTLAYVAAVGELQQVIVRRLAGTAWVPVGTGAISDGLVSAYAPSLALTADGQPVVAWFDDAARIQVRRFDGSTWQSVADALAVTPGAFTSVPQVAVHGSTLVVAWNEFQGSNARLALQRLDLASGGPWTGGYVPGVSSPQELELRLSLDNTGLATLLYRRNSLGGSLRLRAVQESAGGWAPLCGDLGVGAGLSGSHQIVGWGLQHAADGSAIAVEAEEDFATVRAWRCDGTAWQHWGADDGRVLVADNIQWYLQGLAMPAAGAPMLAVQVNAAHSAATRIHTFTAGANGWTALGTPLDVALPGRPTTLAVAPAGADSPVVVFGVTDGLNRGLQSHRFYP